MEAYTMLKNCFRCEQSWNSKVENPKTCPRCGSPLWDKQRLVMPDFIESQSMVHYLLEKACDNNVVALAKLLNCSYASAINYANGKTCPRQGMFDRMQKMVSDHKLHLADPDIPIHR